MIKLPSGIYAFAAVDKRPWCAKWDWGIDSSQPSNLSKTRTARPHSFFLCFLMAEEKEKKKPFLQKLSRWSTNCDMIPVARDWRSFYGRWRKKWGKSLHNQEHCSKLTEVVCTSREASVSRACVRRDHKRAMSQVCGGNQRCTKKKKGTKIDDPERDLKNRDKFFLYVVLKKNWKK